MVAEDSTKNLRVSQKNEFILEFRGNTGSLMPKIEKIPGIIGITPEESSEGIFAYKIESDITSNVRPEVAKAVVGENLELLQIRDVAPTLEDIFHPGNHEITETDR